MLCYSANKIDTENTKKTGKDYYMEGCNLYNLRRYKQARILFKIAAEKFNFTDAQVMIGYMYSSGLGGNVNTEQAKMWCRHAAIKGDVTAQYNLAVILSSKNECNVTNNYKEAMDCFEKAADQGHGSSMYALGNMYQHGQGTEINQKTAFHWYLNAANLGNIESQFRVGRAYQNGLGVNTNTDKALTWFRRSAENGYHLAQLELGMIHMNSINCKSDFDKAVYWLKKSGCAQASLCLAYLHKKVPPGWQDLVNLKTYSDAIFNKKREGAMYDLGMEYLQKEDIEKRNLRHALYWFEKAAEKNYVHALVAIGCLHLLGKVDEEGENIGEAYRHLSNSARLDGANQLQHLDQLKPSLQSDSVQIKNHKKEYKIAMKWYVKVSDDRRIIEKGCISGLTCLGYLYYKGLGVQQDFKKAREIYLTVLRFIDEEDSDANMCLGLLYSKGSGVDRDDERAMKYYQRSAKYLNTYTYNLIGDVYKFGKGVDVDYDKAMEWYKKGAAYKDEHSLLNIHRMYCNHTLNTLNTVNISYIKMISNQKEESPILLPLQEPNPRYSRGESSCQKPNAFYD